MITCLVIAPQPFFTARGTPFSVYYRTMVTAQNGINIDLLTYGEGLDVEIPRLRIFRIPRFKALGNVNVGPSILKVFLDLLMLFWTIGLLVRYRYDYVHAHEEAVFFCMLLKPLFGFKLVYDMHSSLPQQLINFKFTKSQFLIRLFQKLEDSSLKAADVVITICPALAEYVNSRIRDGNKHLLIENSIFEPVKVKSGLSGCKESRPEATKDAEKQLSVIPQGKRFVVYAGTLEPYQGIDILIDSFKMVINEIPETFLIIVGGNNRQVEFFSNIAKRNGIEGYFLFTGRVSHTIAKYYCSFASVQVSPRSEGTNTPLKIYEQLASGIPIVATNIYSHTQILDNNIAILVEPESESLALGIIEALKLDENSRRIAANAKKLYKQKYSRTIYMEKMRQVLELLKVS